LGSGAVRTSRNIVPARVAGKAYVCCAAGTSDASADAANHAMKLTPSSLGLDFNIRRFA